MAWQTADRSVGDSEIILMGFMGSVDDSGEGDEVSFPGAIFTDDTDEIGRSGASGGGRLAIPYVDVRRESISK